MKKYLLFLLSLAPTAFLAAQTTGCISGDCMNGYATFRFPNDIGVYIGQFKNGKQHGQGTFIWPSGEKYEGGWVEGAQTGEATFSWPDGRSQRGLWKDGEIVRVINEGQNVPAATPPVTNTPEKKETAAVTNPPKNSALPTSNVPKNNPSSNGGASIAAANDGPNISITSPQVTRGFVVNTAMQKIDVIGTATDKDGIRQVRVNGLVAWLSAPNKTKSNFQIPVSLVLGQNKIWIEAEDLAGKVNKEEFTIDFSKPTSMPIASGDRPKSNVKVEARSSTAAEGSAFKTALIIGNSKYGGAMLRNSINDADSLSKELRRQGWEVKSFSNLEQEQMESVINEFGNRLKEKGGAGFFYYAGHGVQIDGSNYLIPVNAPIKKQSDVKYKAVNLGTVLDAMNDAGNKMNILVLDACRNNPFAESRSLKSDGGLAAVDNAPVGTFIAYATSPGKAASDGDDTNGLYTQELLKAIRVKGLTIEEVFKKVRKNVRQLSGGNQIPWDASSLEDRFYFQKK